MRAFSRPTSLSRLSLEARIVYTVFCIFMLLGYFTSVWLYADSEIGAAPAAARDYYLGAEVEEETGGREAEGGPALELPSDLPDDESHRELRFERSPRQVMETFHFHLMSISVCLLILSHIFMMCGLSQRLKVAIIAMASASTLIHVLAPPLIRLVSPSFAVLMFPTAILMGIAWLYMTMHPVLEMWIGHSPVNPRPPAPGRARS